MPAQIKFYSDEGCLHELDIKGTIYEVVLGPVTGLDGDLGDRVDYATYAKNVGDQVAMSTVIEKFDDKKKLIAMSDGINDYVDDNLKLGDIKPGGVRLVYLKLVVPSNTDAYIGTPRIEAAFKTLP